MPAVIRSISYPIEYEEKLVELGVDVTKRGTVSQAFRLLIDDAIQRLRAGNPVSNERGTFRDGDTTQPNAQGSNCRN